MKKKNRIIFIVAILLLLVAIVLILRNSSTTLNKKDSAFAVEDTASITRFFIADMNNNQVVISRDANGEWLIDGKFKAHPEKIKSFLKTLSELRVRAPVPIAARNNVIKRMSTLARKIEVYQMGYRINIFNLIKLMPVEKNTKTYYIGDATQDNVGTYMLMEGSDTPYITYMPSFRGYLSSRYNPEASEWRDHTIFAYNLSDIGSVEITYLNEPQKSYRIDISNNDIIMTSLFDNKRIAGYDTARVLTFLTSFDDIRFEALLNDELEQAFIDSVFSAAPVNILKLMPQDGFAQEVQIFHKPGFSWVYDEDGTTMEPFDLDRAYARLNNGEDLMLVQYFVFDRILRSKQYLMGLE